jgi:hypothetical protein
MSKQQSKKNDKNLPVKPRQKPGNKGDFHGLRYDFLIAELAGYMDASRNGKTRSFWPGFFEKYWAKFNWRLSLDDEPVEGATWPDDESLSADELHKKSQAQLFLKAVGLHIFTLARCLAKTNLLENQNLVQSPS